MTGRLVVTLDDDRALEVIGHGSRLRVDIGPLGRRLRSLRLLRSAAILARRLAPMLHRRTLTLVVTRNGDLFVDLGAGVDGGPIARLFGLSHVRVYRKR